jgi:hypothetical protein
VSIEDNIVRSGRSSWGNEVAHDVIGPGGVEALSIPVGGSKLPRMGDRIADEGRAAHLALLDERPALLGERAGKTLWSVDIRPDA